VLDLPPDDLADIDPVDRPPALLRAALLPPDLLLAAEPARFLPAPPPPPLPPARPAPPDLDLEDFEADFPPDFDLAMWPPFRLATFITSR
jgi:hypothetical protein